MGQILLFSGDDSIPPNLGLHDQRAGLKWVHENIRGENVKLTIDSIFGFLHD